jgi:hypothetical protein
MPFLPRPKRAILLLHAIVAVVGADEPSAKRKKI